MAVLAACVALASCKDKQESAPAAKTSAARSARERPGLPGEAAPKLPGAPTDTTQPAQPRPSKPLAVEDARAVLPAIEGTEILGLKQTPDEAQVHGTWCIDGTSADEVAKKVGGWLEQAGYQNIAIRGEARKAGVAAERDGVRFSMVVSASAAQVCAAPAHYFASATLFRL